MAIFVPLLQIVNQFCNVSLSAMSRKFVDKNIMLFCLNLSYISRKEQEKNDAEIGHDKPVVVRYYGDSKRGVMQKYGMHAQRPLVRSAPQLKEKLSRMEIPATDMNDEGKKLFMTTVADGSTIV